MKKHLFLIISLIFLLGMGSASAEFEGVTFDFEDYTTEHSNPPGMNSSNVWELSPGKVDDEHGTSLRVETKGHPGLSFGEDISSGKFLISFEVYFKDFNQYMRLHLTSTSSGSDSHSILRMGKDGIQSASSGKGDWTFDTIYTPELDTWTQVDMLLDMDNKKLTYYVNGKVLDERSINFVDFKYILFRTESGENGSVLYLDNMTFKFMDEGGFDTGYKNTVASPDSDVIDLNFSDLIDSSSLGGVKVYNMGNNPISYSAKEVSYKIESVNAKKVTLRLSEKLGEGNIYKVYAPNVKSAFGEAFKNDTAYFATGGATASVKIIDADFATIPAFTRPLQPVNPASDKEWVKGGVQMVYPQYEDEVAVVKFPASKGTKKYPTNLTTLTRTFDEAFTTDAGIEFKIKVEKGNQRLVVKDSDENSLTVITIKNDGIYSGDTKISDYTADEWFILRADMNFSDQKATISKDGDVIAEDIDISAISNAAVVVFEQENTDVSYNNDEFTKAMYASSALAYVRVYSVKECAAVTIVRFEDEDGNIYYPDEDIPSIVSKMYIKFSDAIDSASIAGNIVLKAGDDEETINGTYDSSKKEYAIELKNYISGSEVYNLTVNGNIKDVSGQGIKQADGTFETATGLVKAKDLTLEAANGNAALKTDIIHTDKSCPTLYLIYAAYKDDMLIDFKYKAINPDEAERNISVTENYEYPDDADVVSAFLWDGFDTMIPMTKMQTK